MFQNRSSKIHMADIFFVDVAHSVEQEIASHKKMYLIAL